MELEPTLIARHSTVLVELVDSSNAAEQVTLTLVESKQADFKSGLLDENAPLGRALIGHRAGDVVPYEIGDLKEIRILSVEQSETVPLDAAEKRRQVVRTAEAQAEIINQLNFATASGSKWGDYDVDVKKLMEQRQTKEDNASPDS